jgi:hypothetical protein
VSSTGIKNLSTLARRQLSPEGLKELALELAPELAEAQPVATDKVYEGNLHETKNYYRQKGPAHWAGHMKAVALSMRDGSNGQPSDHGGKTAYAEAAIKRLQEILNGKA